MLFYLHKLLLKCFFVTVFLKKEFKRNVQSALVILCMEAGRQSI